MKITLECSPKEAAVLITELQERQNCINTDYKQLTERIHNNLTKMFEERKIPFTCPKRNDNENNSGST